MSKHYPLFIFLILYFSGNALALCMSWKINHSVLFAVIDFILGWIYVSFKLITNLIL